eukprot:TRINITY_DN1888_c1_g1_i1.p1 TRINITY_DN1888_c1_g1~~TRINITY_DN1888_c1_g1_i1.p1  ORF type:complete len:551 (+),score=190.58 TRINITY_DN1888_c1_g1_i1:70-1653(+)
MFAGIKKAFSGGGKGGGQELALLQQENAELTAILREYRHQLAEGRVQELLAEKARDHAKRRVGMDAVCGPQRGFPHADPAAPLQTAECTPFGAQMRQKHFDLTPYYLNSASYGATPRPVQEARRRYDQQAQQNPVLWRLRELPQRLKEAESMLARVLRCDPTNLRFIMNCNAATSSVLKALPWEVGDCMLTFSIDYDATKNACRWLERTHGVFWREVEMMLPMTDDEILSAVEAELRAIQSKGGPMPKLANFCHVTSKTAYIFPAKRLTELFHRYGVPVLIDGAQAAGHLDLNVADIGADWYIGTVHKWMYSNQGVAFIVAAPEKHSVTSPLTVSYFDGEGFSEFDYCGLQDFSTWCAVKEALEFVDQECGGWSNVRAKCRQQALECVNILTRMWRLNEPPFNLKPGHACQGGIERYGNMPIVPLPGGDGVDPAAAGKVMGFLMAKHNITAFLLMQRWGGMSEKGTLCIRCSCQIYTDPSDWEALGRAVNELQGNYSVGTVISAYFGKSDDKSSQQAAEATLAQMSA